MRRLPGGGCGEFASGLGLGGALDGAVMEPRLQTEDLRMRGFRALAMQAVEFIALRSNFRTLAMQAVEFNNTMPTSAHSPTVYAACEFVAEIGHASADTRQQTSAELPECSLIHHIRLKPTETWRYTPKSVGALRTTSRSGPLKTATASQCESRFVATKEATNSRQRGSVMRGRHPVDMPAKAAEAIATPAASEFGSVRTA